MTRLARAIAVALLALLAAGAAPAWCAPQTDETGTAACCPDPRFVGPLSRDGQGLQAAFDTPTGIAYDSRDDAFFIADPGSNTIRRVDSQWRVTTVAGACERELVMATCVGRELDGPGSLARFDRPSLIAYDARDRGLLIYDDGSSVLRLLSDGVVATLGRVTDLTSLAVDNVHDLWFGAQRKSVVELLYSGLGDIQPSEIWHANRFAHQADAAAYDVNAVAVDSESGDVFAGAYATTIVRLPRDKDFHALALAGSSETGFSLDAYQGSDGTGSGARIHGIRALTYDPDTQSLVMAEGHVLRTVSFDGTVRTVAGGCRRSESRYRGEFACDYGARDGRAASAHFVGSIHAIAIDTKNGNVAVLDGRLLRVLWPNGDVVTVAGNQGPPAQTSPSNWSGRYLDATGGQTLDVTVEGDDETEVLRNAKGDVFDVRRGKRSLAKSNVEFWNADTFVRIGTPSRPVSFESALADLECGSLGRPVTENPFPSYMGTKAEKLFVSWFRDQYAPTHDAQFFTSSRCAAFRALRSGESVYEEYESRTVPHTVPDGLTVYPDERLALPGFVL